jgi:hypothetical protein
MPYVIAPLGEVKGLNNWPEYVSALRELQEQAFARADGLWQGFSKGGINPIGQRYGIGPLRPNDMAHDVTDSTPSGTYTFRKNILVASTWRDLFNFNTRNNLITALAGFAITDDVLRLNALRIEIGGNKFPIMDIQEAQRYERAAILLKTDQGAPLIIDPQTFVQIRAYVESVGWQRVVPLGFQLFKVKDLVLTEV